MHKTDLACPQMTLNDSYFENAEWYIPVGGSQQMTDLPEHCRSKRLCQTECANAQANDTHIMDLSYIHFNPWPAADLNLIYPGKKWAPESNTAIVLFVMQRIAHACQYQVVQEDCLGLENACVMRKCFRQDC